MLCTALGVTGLGPLGAVPAAATGISVATGAVLGSNLVTDGGAEQATGDPTGYTQVPIPGWTVTGSLTAVPYTAGGGFPTASSPGSPTRGSYFFAGGNGSGTATATQTEDVSALAARIDTGTIGYNLSGWLGGYSTQGDAAQVTATFLNSAGAALGSSTIGPVTASDRGETTEFLQRAATGNLPVGTRSVQIVLSAVDSYGYNDGYADDLSLVLSQSSTSGNLLANPGAEAGEGSGTGYDQTTIPGWQEYGMVTAVKYAAGGGFPTASSPGSPNRGANFFSGGAEGNSSLTQSVNVSAAASAIDTGTVTANLSGWLGGYATQGDSAQVTATFLNAAGASLGTGSIGPVSATDRGLATGMLQRSSTVAVPVGTRSISVVVQFTVSTGPYDDGYADDLALTLSTPLPAAPAPVPPVSTVPVLDHVFFVMMENEDNSQIIGNTSQAPYLNSLATKYAVSGNEIALAHPSDPNYVGFFSGSTWGYDEDSTSTALNVNNLADEIEAAGKTWKFYNQTMPSPCYTSSSGEYEADDTPFTWFSDIAGNTARCDAHILPLTSMAGDLSSTATTPDFAWLSADDCYDMEGCGITSGDTWLSQTLPTILNSPSWQTQKDVIIITWDEDDKANDQTPEQHIPTLVIGSPNAPVKTGGFTSQNRYTGYSLTRTVEGALGLPPMTLNDAYAAPLNDFFTHAG
ncbi:hypothetical protein GXW83_24160 [Streptacidiphilus sp. PB12-B1b]|uniref:alkaline phosphatase family protein n=1 Tax=Streptacidiphilus sp. PB12-B1b TaxID=2705012 RepID=UPI0015FAF964|nr:alkaline phosphatase family protein [Streptacidiphilus sp. PB12-B1b]QMU78340.1 hypothetical protein GXW83_24160 [Streptacidiphilus sp. PB12-B1b]